MSDDALLVIAVAGVAALLLLILKAKVQPFVALVVVSVGVALAAGVPAADVVRTVEEGMGATLGHIATIIALGAMIGRIIELSGGAHAFAHALIDRFGGRHTPLALTVAGFVIGIPVFFEVGLIILMPIAYGVARAARRPLLVYALPMGAAMLTVHAFLPPHPGAVAAVEAIGADQGLVLLMGIPLTAVVVLLGHLMARRLTRRAYPMDPAVHAEVYGDREPGPGGRDSGTTGAGDAAPDLTAPDLTTSVLASSPSAVGDGHGTAVLARPAAVATGIRPPSPGMVLTLIVTPILLILLGTLGQNLLADGSPLRAVLTVLGAPMVALLIDVALCAYFLGVRRGWSRARLAEVMGSALPSVAMVILVAGAGGVFGKVLIAGGVGDAVAGVLERSGLSALALAFVTALALRAALGSTTVALITAAGILTPLLQRAELSTGQLSLVALAMGAGGLAVSHVNDAGYWMFTRLAGLDVPAGLRTWTVLTTAMGLTGFGLTACLWPLV
ncbi:SLC13 family permease [Streptomyces sp. NPDC013178]|uniref:GntT/GntP/DsdX family permease n=1 Tax=Streptomyces sp. NPDC013178 TaxID=3155118 RepID=UPI0033D26464